ncbi:hypothetical protein [Pajaroellobacter abortibovis]|uniref:Uncharacterized protein n=1 Tax=Pajaroellobacter abortibovis TaxID=1882918 RepID=A0A1L6MXE4_9BACT|nr:hypothetical protein [Pajaroellobacter abortibovis]APS00105.1 hypothetical protein BCY86_04980 [Pajaroellobacter abortibovis]
MSLYLQVDFASSLNQDSWRRRMAERQGREYPSLCEKILKETRDCAGRQGLQERPVFLFVYRG